jgi:hypothetical protein
LSYSGIDEIPVSLIRKSHFTNLLAAENGVLLLLSPFKIPKEIGQASRLPAQII